MNSDLTEAFASLLKKYGSHSHVAKKLGISPDHYRKIRNGRANIPPRTANYIILKAYEFCSVTATPTTPPGAGQGEGGGDAADAMPRIARH